MKCSMTFLDADVKRPFPSVSAIVDEGNVVVFGQHESFIPERKHGSEESNVQEEWRVRDAIGHSEDDEIRDIQRGSCD